MLTDIGCVIQQVIQAKRMEIRGPLKLNLASEHGEEPYGFFANVDPMELAAVLSNLLNNALEAVSRDTGEVTLTVSGTPDTIRVTIDDNGKGIPEDILARLGKEQISFGKEQGSGIGCLHAATCVQSWQGQLGFERKSKGTTVSISLPRQKAPPYFVPALVIPHDRHVIVVDDNESIPQIWKLRKELKRHHFTVFDRLADFQKWWSEQAQAAREQCVVLMDLMFPNEEPDGLQAIESLRFGDPNVEAYLVSGNFDDREVQNRATFLGVGIVPKTAIHSIRILTEK